MIAVSLVAVLSLLQLNHQRQSWSSNLEDSLQVIDLLDLKYQASQVFETSAATVPVVAAFPEYLELSNPLLGFVHHPLKTIRYTNQSHLSSKQPCLIYSTPTSKPKLQTIIEKNQPTKITSFTKNNLTVAIYTLTACRL